MPNHPSWPAELVEKASRAIYENRVGIEPGSAIKFAAYPYDKQAALAVLSALSGDLVPREAMDFDGDVLYRVAEWARSLPHLPDRKQFAAEWATVAAAVSSDDTNESNTTLDEVEVPWSLPASDTPGIELVLRSQADALAEALERTKRSIEMLLESDTTIPHDLRFDLTEAMNEGRSALASYRSSSWRGR